MWGARGISEDRRGTAPSARALVYIAYALPALPLAALALPLYVIVPTFYSEAIGLPVAAVGTVLLAIRLLDAATDPVFGWLADRWRGRGGRRRGFFIASLPLTAGSAFMLFWPPGEAGLGYLAFWAALVSIGFTWTSLPYTAWGAELSSDYSERTRISAFREGATLIGIVLATSLPFSIGLTGGGGMHGLQAMAILVAVLLPISGLAAVVLVPEPVNRSSRDALCLAADRPEARGNLADVALSARQGGAKGAASSDRRGRLIRAKPARLIRNHSGPVVEEDRHEREAKIGQQQ